MSQYYCYVYYGGMTVWTVDKAIRIQWSVLPCGDE